MMHHIADEAEHIYLALGATDFRKQQNGLAALVSLKFKLDPYCGKSVFLFCNKKHSSLRALRWDGNGFILVTKFLSDEMKFQWPKNQGEVRAITKRQLEWLLEGLQEKVQSLEHNVEVLTQAVLHAAKQRFGASSEKAPQIYGQCFLFGELIDEIPDEAENKVINIKEHKRPVRKKGDQIAAT